MKKILFWAFALTTIIGTGCQKDDDTTPTVDNRPDCEKNKWGTLKVNCYLDDPYKVYIDGSYKGTVSANSSVSYANISSGTHATKYIQQSGYILYPTEYSLSVNISDCATQGVNVQ